VRPGEAYVNEPVKCAQKYPRTAADRRPGAYDDDLRRRTVLPDERGIGDAVEARVEHQDLAVTANVDEAEQPLKQRGAGFALIGDEGKLVGFDAVAGGFDPGDESLIPGPGASDAIGIEQPLERGRSRAAKAAELLRIRFKYRDRCRTSAVPNWWSTSEIQ
jgi:hypothetical protein